MRFKVKALLVIVVLVYSKYVVDKEIFSLMESVVVLYSVELLFIVMKKYKGKGGNYVVDKLKKTLNNALSNFAQKIQVNTGSFLVWGEIKLPEEIRKEIEYKNINKEWQ